MVRVPRAWRAPGSILVAGLALAGCSHDGPARGIVIVTLDTTRADRIGCYGYALAETPNLDRLAAQGMRFTAAYADSQCSPTRAAFLSGQYGARTGVFKVLNEPEPTRAPLRSAEASAVLPPEAATLAQPFDPMAGGFPVPPMPGQSFTYTSRRAMAQGTTIVQEAPAAPADSSDTARTEGEDNNG